MKAALKPWAGSHSMSRSVSILRQKCMDGQISECSGTSQWLENSSVRLTLLAQTFQIGLFIYGRTLALCLPKYQAEAFHDAMFGCMCIRIP